MQRAKYTPELKENAVSQVIDKGHSVIDAARSVEHEQVTEFIIKWLATIIS